MPRDLSELLRSTAEGPSRPLDVGSVRARARRRRLARRGSGTAAVMAVLGGVALLIGALSQPNGDVDLVDDVPTEESEPEDDQGGGERGERESDRDDADTPVESRDLGPELALEDLEGLPAEGVAVDVGDHVALVSVDEPGRVLGHVPGKFARAPQSLWAPTASLLPLVTADGEWVWAQPHSGEHWPAEAGIPLNKGFRVVGDDDANEDERRRLVRRGDGEPWGEADTVVASWPGNAAWWVTPDHRVVTWAVCTGHDCAHEWYDTASGARGELEAGCWVAAADAEGRTLICEQFRYGLYPIGGREVRVVPSAGDPVEVRVPDGSGRDPGKATAVFEGGIVRIDHDPCETARAHRLVDGGLPALIGDGGQAPESAVPLGTTRDGRTILHLNQIRCGDPSQRPPAEEANRPGIYALDDETGGLRLLWPVRAGKHAARMWSAAPDLAEAPDARPASQTAEEAERDGVVRELAALPLSLRGVPVDLADPAEVDTAEGTWMLARPHPDVLGQTTGCGLGDPDGMYGRDIVCVMEYGEVLLVDESGERVERAYPLPQVPPQWIEVTDEAVYCGRQGDGGLPTSMLCRIDRETGEATVRVFPHEEEDGAPSQGITDSLGDYIEHAGWVVDAGLPGGRFGEAEVTDSGLVIEGHDGRALVDPETLELTLDP